MEDFKNGLSNLVETSMGKIKEALDSNSVVGKPITTPDGVTLIPVSRMEFGLGTGGSDYGKAPHFAAGAGVGAKIEPVAFVICKEGVTRIVPVALPAVSTVDRIIEMVPQIMDRVENLIDKNEVKDEY